MHCSSGVPIVVITVPFRSVGTGGGLYQSLSLGAERNSKEIEREGGREIKWERYFYLLTVPFRSVFLYNFIGREGEGDREINYSGMINLTCPNATILIS